MESMKQKLPAAQELGKRGGMATLKKHGKRQMKIWGKTGGRPRNDGLPHGSGGEYRRLYKAKAANEGAKLDNKQGK